MVGEVAGKRIVTIEGLAPAGKLHAVQEAFLEADAIAVRLLHLGNDSGGGGAVAEQADPSDAEIVAGMNGHNLPVRDVSEDRPRRSRGGPERRPGMRRRDFFAAMGGGIAVLLVDDAGAQQRGGAAEGAAADAQDVGAWLHIGEDGVVTAYTGKVEIGAERANMR